MVALPGTEVAVLAAGDNRALQPERPRPHDLGHTDTSRSELLRELLRELQCWPHSPVLLP